MKNVDYWINQLRLLPHPEGGFYKETYRSSETVSSSALPDRFDGDRNFSTAIYFLLRSGDRSVFHRIKSDELWHFYQGSTLSIYLLQQNDLKILKMVADMEKRELLQVAIPANCWFGARVDEPGSYALCGCTVSPGFDFRDFEMARKEYLLEAYPEQAEIIAQLTHA